MLIGQGAPHLELEADDLDLKINAMEKVFMYERSAYLNSQSENL